MKINTIQLITRKRKKLCRIREKEDYDDNNYATTAWQNGEVKETEQIQRRRTITR